MTDPTTGEETEPKRKGARFVFGPPVRREGLAGLRRAQVALILVGFAAAAALIRFQPNAMGAFGGVVLVGGTGWLALDTLRGRGFDEWLPALCRWVGLTVRRHASWRSSAPAAGVTELSAAGKGKADPPSPIGSVQLLYATVRGTDVGVLKDRSARTWTAALRVEGSSFALLDTEEQERRLQGWASVEAALARHGNPVSRIQIIERTVPEPGDEMARYLAERAAHPDDHPAVVSYRELLAAAGPVTQRHECYLAVQISQRRAHKAIKRAGGGDAGAVAVLAEQLLDLQRQLRDVEVGVSGAVSGPMLGALLREGVDPGAGAAAATAADGLGFAARNAWPLATETEWGRYRTDGVWHITYWIAEWPRMAVGPRFLSPLLLATAGLSRSVSITIEPIEMTKALRKVERAQTQRDADEDLRRRNGYRSSARRRRESEALTRREEELSVGHAECIYRGFVTVTHSDPDQLEEEAATLEQTAYQCPVELRRLYGEQDTGFWATQPLCHASFGTGFVGGGW